MRKVQHFPLIDKLHTDVLEEKYGPISAQVLRHNAVLREAHLIDRTGVSRTYALTFFSKGWTKEVRLVDAKIKSGSPIGKAFREAGFAIRKNVIDVLIVKIPVWLKSAFGTKERFAKARLSEFYAKKEGEPVVNYGTVIEIYSPDFRTPLVNAVDIAQISAPTDFLEKEGLSPENIWTRIGSESEFKDVPQYVNARLAALKTVRDLEKKIKIHLASSH